MKTSVVVCTYNGEKFIVEQLESIMMQSRKVDEVLIKDDKSTDDTVAICKEFIDKNKLDNWHVIVNDKNLGYYENFMSGLKIAEGEILFLCDQDDIWLENKVEEMTGIMEQNPNILSLATTFSRFDNGGIVLDQHVKHPNVNKNSLRKVSKRDFYQFFTYLGMSMAVRKELIDEIKTKNEKNITHDIIINYYAVRKDGLYFLDKVLTKRRSYEESVSNSRIYRERQEKFGGSIRRQQIYRHKNTLGVFQNIEVEQFGKRDTLIDRLCSYYDVRDRYLKNKKPGIFLVSIFNIRKYESFTEYMRDGKELLRSK